MTDVDKGERVVAQAALVSQQIREALNASLPTADEQMMTIQIPGAIVDTSLGGGFYWDPDKTVMPPHSVRVNEARLVDGMIPLSKIMLGPIGKSVARSYEGALDMLIPVDAPIDDAKQDTAAKSAAALRYTTAMNYLTSKAPNSVRSVIDVYVEKQEAYTIAMADWDKAKIAAQSSAEARNPGTDDASLVKRQKDYDDWNQENFRHYKAHAQTKYMDWVVNGNKYKVEYYFGIVDVSSAMKRVESSKEAARNLVVIDPDGTTEWQQVSLSPRGWAKMCDEKVRTWRETNGKLNRKDYESEIKRLSKLLSSYHGLLDSVDPEKKIQQSITGEPAREQAKAALAKLKAEIAALEVDAAKVVEETDEAGKTAKAKAESDLTTAKARLPDLERTATDPAPVVPLVAASDDRAGEDLAVAYKELYLAQASDNSEKLHGAQVDLQAALEKYSSVTLAENKKVAGKLAGKGSRSKVQWLLRMIDESEKQIDGLKDALNHFSSGNVAVAAVTDVMVSSDTPRDGASQAPDVVTQSFAEAGDQLAAARFRIPRDGVVPPQSDSPAKPNQWTKISLSISASTQQSAKSSIASSSSLSVSGSYMGVGASVGGNYSRAATKASESASNCDVDISFDALLVQIDRAWLHGELFSDPELNTSPDVKLSPGANSIKKWIAAKNVAALGDYPYFPSYPTAFIVACNVNLEFRGNTSDLESAVESSHFDAKAKVSYGPFSLSASHSQDKTSAKTKMETTSTGTRITLEAPAIIGWVSTILPQLPRPTNINSMLGPLF